MLIRGAIRACCLVAETVVNAASAMGDGEAMQLGVLGAVGIQTIRSAARETHRCADTETAHRVGVVAVRTGMGVHAREEHSDHWGLPRGCAAVQHCFPNLCLLGPCGVGPLLECHRRLAGAAVAVAARSNLPGCPLDGRNRRAGVVALRSGCGHRPRVGSARYRC